MRRVEGPAARELFLHCQPPPDVVDAGRQAEAVYRAVVAVLAGEGASPAAVVAETLFLRSVRDDLAPVRAARGRVLAACHEPPARPAITEIEQPPLNERARLEVAVQALLPLPEGPPVRFETVDARPACGCAECARGHGLRVRVGREVRLHAAGLYGAGRDTYEQALAMFAAADELLRQAGMEFRDVVRTWIHLRDIDRDYTDLNRARRAFFEARGIDPAPASTGIGGGPVPEEHALCLGLYAVASDPAGPGARAPARAVMTAPTLNEAARYGADFARGIRIEDANKVSLYVSGTASIDEAGRTAHAGDFEAQADRMLVNVAALLAGQRASFADVVSAVTYLKRPADAPRLRKKLREAGFEGFPHVWVQAPVCRPELLCETEALAVLAREAPAPSGA